jgi:FlaA1/EpsC-like NDP-sugar epimerase
LREPPEIADHSICGPPPAGVRISPSALLGRQQDLRPSPRARQIVSGRTALVTGAGGSIGSEVVRQLTGLGARRVICVDRDEYALYRLQLGLTGEALLTDEAMILADVANGPELEAVFAQHRPELVFHAAACKHLPLLERAPAQAILTNVQGTMNVAMMAARYGAGHFVNISTDKAARPVSVLGMTKRIAERVTAHYAQGVSTCAASVRFGNVFASRGSFIETLAHQVALSRPVTITDPHMARFFMTIPQAVGLVIEAAGLADNKSIFTLDMGEPYSILQLARDYAVLAGAGDLPIVCTGRRPGEKIHEELAGPGETGHETDHPAITAVSVEPSDHLYQMAVRGLVHAARAGVSPGILRRELAAVAGAPLPEEEL